LTVVLKGVVLVLPTGTPVKVCGVWSHVPGPTDYWDRLWSAAAVDRGRRGDIELGGDGIAIDELSPHIARAIEVAGNKIPAGPER